MSALALLFWACAAVGLGACAVQTLLLAGHRRRPRPHLRSDEPLSVLKPLCGLEDELEVNLASFLDQDHGRYELLLGCRSERDPAWPVARALEARHPGRVRAVLQQGEPGLNPKVNQLLTLARHARHDLVVISDSNVRVGPGYLSGIAARMADPAVGLVTHPVAGAGAVALGSRLDNLHLSATVTLGVVAAKAALGQDIVVGKSMALRRSDLAQLGGFESVQDLLAEDFVLGRRVAELGKRVELAPEPVLNVSRQASVSAFLARYGRWSVMQRRTAGLGLHLAQGLLTPVTWAALAGAASPSRPAALALLGVAVARALLELSARALLTGERPWRDLPLSPLKELLASACWLRGLLTDRINWRGNLLRVRSGSVLEPIEGWVPRPAPAEAPARP